MIIYIVRPKVIIKNLNKNFPLFKCCDLLVKNFSMWETLRKVNMTKTTIGPLSAGLDEGKGEQQGEDPGHVGGEHGGAIAQVPLDMWILIGIVSQDEYFFVGPKIRNSNILMRAYGFHNFQLSFCEGNPK